MVEIGNFAERYGRMSLWERNVEFRQLYGQLPVNPPFEIMLDRRFSQEQMDEILSGSFDRRQESEHRVLLMARVKTLLKHSGFTSSGQVHLIEQFSSAYDTGVPKPISDLPIASSIPDNDLENAEEGLIASDLIKMAIEDLRGHPNFPVFLLEEENPDSAGIFDTNRGDLEWGFYDWYVSSMRVLTEVLMKKVQEKDGLSGRFMHDYYSKQNVWQSEIITKHGKKP